MKTAGIHHKVRHEAWNAPAHAGIWTMSFELP